MDEHFVLLDLAGDVRRHLGERANAEAMPALRRGVFPVAVVTLGADEWETVSTAHAEEPSFLRTG